MAFFADTHRFGPLLLKLRATAADLAGVAVLRTDEARSYRTSLRALRALSDRDLADLGIARSDLKRIARHTARRGR